MSDLLADPKVRRAYILAKVAVFLVAAVATIPLANVMGSKAWLALGIFGMVLLVMTVMVLSLGKLASPSFPTNEPEPVNAISEVEALGEVVVPVEDFIDLHPFPPRDIPDVVLSYLETAVEAGFHEVRLIHGRGTGVQRQRVRKTLEGHPAVLSFSDATADRGGWGATVVKLVSP